MPHHDVGIFDRAILSDVLRQSGTASMEIWVVTARIFLSGIVRSHPDMLCGEATALVHKRPRLGEHDWTWRDDHFVAGRLADAVLLIGIDDFSSTGRCCRRHYA